MKYNFCELYSLRIFLKEKYSKTIKHDKYIYMDLDS